jgi:hypothetical protein
MALFAVTEQVDHHVGDPACTACAEPYPEPCPCGGLIHAAAADATDADGNPLLDTRCDHCGRSEDDLDLV